MICKFFITSIWKINDYHQYFNINLQISDKGYIKGSFAALMAKSLNDEGWYQLLTDIDKYENYCEMGSVSSPYIDFPQARLYFCMKIFQKKNLTQTFFLNFVISTFA